jgi:hypothetical protein
LTKGKKCALLLFSHRKTRRKKMTSATFALQRPEKVKTSSINLQKNLKVVFLIPKNQVHLISVYLQQTPFLLDNPIVNELKNNRCLTNREYKTSKIHTIKVIKPIRDPDYHFRSVEISLNQAKFFERYYVINSTIVEKDWGYVVSYYLRVNNNNDYKEPLSKGLIEMISSNNSTHSLKIFLETIRATLVLGQALQNTNITKIELGEDLKY